MFIVEEKDGRRGTENFGEGRERGRVINEVVTSARAIPEFFFSSDLYNRYNITST